MIDANQPNYIPFADGVRGVLIKDNLGEVYDAEISEDHMRRIMYAGLISDDDRERLFEGLRYLVVEASMIVVDLEAGPSGPWQTRRQLKRQLTELRKRALKGDLPPVSDWLQDKIEQLDSRRRLNLPFYKYEEVRGQEDFDRHIQAEGEATQRLRDCLCDPELLATLITDTLDFLERCPETTQEWAARKNAFKPVQQWAIQWSHNYWTVCLGRPNKVSDKLVHFTDEILRLLNITDATPDAIRKQLDDFRRKVNA